MYDASPTSIKTSFGYEIYAPQVENSTSLLVVSYPSKPDIVLGKTFGTSYVAYADIVNGNINGQPTPFNFNYPLQIIDTNSNRSDWIVYFKDCMLIHNFIPKYESIAYILAGNESSPLYYEEFELNGKSTYPYYFPADLDSEYLPGNMLDLNRPKFMFSTDKQTWKIWDSANQQWTEVTPDNGSYFTFDEFLTKGMTYTQYTQIPDSAFTDSDIWYVMVNNYPLSFSLKSSYVDNYIGVSNIVKVEFDVYEYKLIVVNLT